ncbi:hypothetical protein Tco_0421938 [Tanacetum coccineum]
MLACSHYRNVSKQTTRHLPQSCLRLTLEGFPFVTVNTKEYHSECSGKISRIMRRTLCYQMLFKGTSVDMVERDLNRCADIVPTKLDQDLYDSWKSRMDLYMQNKEHRRMILELVEHGPLIWPMVEENGVIRTKKYVELSAAKKIQADCDMKATNIILQGTSNDKQKEECRVVYALEISLLTLRGNHFMTYYLRFTQLINDMNIYKMKMEQFQVNTKFLSSLSPEWSKFMTDVKLETLEETRLIRSEKERLEVRRNIKSKRTIRSETTIQSENIIEKERNRLEVKRPFECHGTSGVEKGSAEEKMVDERLKEVQKASTYKKVESPIDDATRDESENESSPGSEDPNSEGLTWQPTVTSRHVMCPSLMGRLTRLLVLNGSAVEGKIYEKGEEWIVPKGMKKLKVEKFQRMLRDDIREVISPFKCTTLEDLLSRARLREADLLRRKNKETKRKLDFVDRDAKS